MEDVVFSFCSEGTRKGGCTVLFLFRGHSERRVYSFVSVPRALGKEDVVCIFRSESSVFRRIVSPRFQVQSAPIVDKHDGTPRRNGVEQVDHSRCF